MGRRSSLAEQEPSWEDGSAGRRCHSGSPGQAGGASPALPCPAGNPQPQLHRVETELCTQSQLNKLQNIFRMQMNFNQFPN